MKNKLEQSCFLTILTPTYNRAHTLSKVYESLCAQTDRRFVWAIIDDGSTDDTSILVEKWQKGRIIPIVYRRKANTGKAASLNVGLSYLSTPYVVCLDSDDVFAPNAVEMAIKELQQTETDTNCCGMLALRNNPDGSVMGRRRIPLSYTKITAADVFLKLTLKTELICFYKTDIVRKYRFPEFSNEKFVSPAWMQYRVTQNYYFYPSQNCYCFCEYIEDGLTKNKKKVIINNPKGYTCVKLLSFNLSSALWAKIKHGIMYNYGTILSKDKNWLQPVQHKIWAIVLRPVAWGYYLIQKKQGNIYE